MMMGNLVMFRKDSVLNILSKRADCRGLGDGRGRAFSAVGMGRGSLDLFLAL